MDCENRGVRDLFFIWNISIIGREDFLLFIKGRRIYLRDVRRSISELVRVLEDIRLDYVIGG